MASSGTAVLLALSSLLVIPALFSPFAVLRFIFRPLAFLVGGLILSFALAYLVAIRRRARPRRTLPRQLAFTTPAAWSSARVRHTWAQARSTAHEPLHPAMSAELNASIDSLFAIVISAFVSQWYDQITGPGAHQGFPNAIERLVRTSLSRVLARCEKVDWVDLLVATIVPRATNHLSRFREAEVRLRGTTARMQAGSSALAGSDELDLLLANDYARQLGGLHPAVDVSSFSSRPSEEAHLRHLVDRILPLVLPEREVQSPAVRKMAREIVACTIVLPLIEKLTDPDWWNVLIEEKLSKSSARPPNSNQLEIEINTMHRKMVNQLREALDAAPAVRSSSTRRAKGSIEISAETGTKEFDRFLRSIKRCATIGEARRLRSDVDVNMRRSQLALSTIGDSSEPAQRRRAAELTVYIERLSVAQERIDRRVRELGGDSAAPTNARGGADATSHVSLHDVLQQPAALPLFMEHMDRCHRLALVEFYLTVEGLKDPLEDLESSEGEMELRQLNTLREDVQMLWSTYFASQQVRLSPQHVAVLRDFCTSPAESQTARTARAAKRSVYMLQKEAYDVMEENDFPAYRRSDLFLKTASAMPVAAKQRVPSQDLPVPRRTYTPPAPVPASRPGPIMRAQSHPAPAQSPLSSSAFAPAPALATATLHRTDTAPPQVTFRPAFDLDGPSHRVDPPPREDPLKFLMASPNLEGKRKPIFEEEDETPEGPDDGGDIDYVQVQTIEAIQDALNSILETDSRSTGGKTAGKSTASLNALPVTATKAAIPGGGRRVVSASPGTKTSRTRTSQLAPRPRPESPSGGRPNAVSMPLPRRPIFDDDEDLAADGGSISDSDGEGASDTESTAAPLVVGMVGDLEMQKELDKLDARVETLRGQQDVLEALVRKAELTGNARELKLLGKSRSALHRELRGIEYQRAQLEAQAAEHRLVPGRVNIAISGSTIGEAQGKSFVLYLVEVHQLDEEGGRPVSGWFVTRRYSEFDQLDRALRDKVSHFRAPELPSKHLVTSLSGSLVEQRRVGLERYLQAVVKLPAACASSELRTFLSQANITLPPLDDGSGRRLTSLIPGQSLVRTLYRSITTGIDDIFSGSSMMDAVIQRLSQQAAGGGPVREEDMISSGMLAAAMAETTAAGVGSMAMSTPLPAEGITSFTAPLCDFFVELFGLEAASNWLRRQAILIVLQQVLGGTIERKFRDSVKAALTSANFVVYIGALKDAMFPGGLLRKPEVPAFPRSAEQKAVSRDAAARSLSALMPAMAANIIGRNNARRAARNIFAILQSARLNRHLAYSVIDDILDVIFPELKSK